MTIIEAINQIDNIKPNNYSQAEKVRWLAKLDGMVKAEIIDTHEGGDDVVFNGYTEDNMNVVMLVPAPYDDIYVKWLEAQIDYANNEYGRYNNSSAAFNSVYSSYASDYHRKHMPLGKKINFF